MMMIFGHLHFEQNRGADVFRPIMLRKWFGAIVARTMLHTLVENLESTVQNGLFFSFPK